jgi:hypothetical protein
MKWGIYKGVIYVAWLQRKEKRYYYRSQRVEGRVVCRYAGTGPVAELTARIDALCRTQRRLEEEKAQEESARWELADAPLLRLERCTDLLVRAALVLAGYHRHHRGPWRKRRGPVMSEAPDRPAPSPPADLEHLKELLAQAERGDGIVLSELRPALEAHLAIWEQYGDLARQARDSWLDHIADDNLVLRESLTRRLGAFGEDLTAEQSSPLEQLLIGRLVACRLLTECADLISTRSLTGSESARRVARRRPEVAQRRLLAAIKQLACVRKLLKPPRLLRILPVKVIR